MNQLKMATVQTILTLHEQGWSCRRIAQELGIRRETVARHLQEALASSKPATEAPHGSEVAVAEAESTQVVGRIDPATISPPVNGHQTSLEDSSKPATEAPHGSAVVVAPKPAQAPHGSGVDGDEAGDAPVASRSACQPWAAVITQKLEQGLSGQRIYQDLLSEHGFTGSYYSVRRFVSNLDDKQPLPFRRLECGPGEEVQIDFGSGPLIVEPDGKRRRTHIFRMVLSHSRKAYSEAVHRQTTDALLACIENGFWSWGGSCRRVVLDNLRAAVQQADWYDPELNPKMQTFAEHYGVAILPTRPYTPRHKGKIERGIGYVKDNALKARTFASLAEVNHYLCEWERTVADTRVHGTIRRQVSKVFNEVERACLRPLPLERFPFFHEGQRQVHRDGHVEVDKAYYSVPPEYVMRRVWVRWDTRLVRVYNTRLELIVTHAKQEPGRFSTHEPHIPEAKISGVERGAAWLLNQVRRLGPQAASWAQGLLEARGVEGVRALPGLLALAKHYPSEAIEQACGAASKHGAFQLRPLRKLLVQQAARQESSGFLQEHPLIRPLAAYAQFVATVCTH
jgi:transposase